jgi:hypothetical protein
LGGLKIVLTESVVKRIVMGDSQEKIEGNGIERLDNVVTTSSDLLTATPTLKP